MINLKIIYGSQTGNAQDIAEKIYRYSLNLPIDHYSISMQEMNSFNFDKISDADIFIFICSTTGQGDPPENMKTFWNKIMMRSFPTILNHCNFAVFGLGDSKYQKYNFIAKKLYRRLLQLNANPLLNLGLADDQHPFGIDGEFLPWLKQLWQCLSDKLEKDVNVTNLFELCTKSTIIKKYDANIIDKDECDYNMICSSEYSKIYLKFNNRETPIDHFQETRLLTFNKSNLTYQIGDVLSILPQNSIDNVNLFFKLTNINKDDVICIKSLDSSYSLPENFPRSSIQTSELVKHCFDLNGIPRKSFFEMFATLSMHEVEKERLMELSSPSNLDDLYSYCFYPRRMLIEVLEDFPNTTNQLNLNEWLNIMPFMRPREYSIASSPIVHTNDISILVAVVKYKTKLKHARRGLCSNFLSNLNANEFIFGKIKNGSLTFPPNDKSVILIGPGTGIAAFRGCISERTAESVLSETLLCYGCRYSDKDFYFSNEFNKLKVEGKLKLITAFSREENCYIQNKLKEQSNYIFNIILNLSGYIFVCGRSVDMPQQVNDAIKMILVKEGNLSENDAIIILMNMEKSKRYQIETWT